MVQRNPAYPLITANFAGVFTADIWFEETNVLFSIIKL